MQALLHNPSPSPTASRTPPGAGHRLINSTVHPPDQIVGLALAIPFAAPVSFPATLSYAHATGAMVEASPMPLASLPRGAIGQYAPARLPDLDAPLILSHSGSQSLLDLDLLGQSIPHEMVQTVAMPAAQPRPLPMAMPPQPPPPEPTALPVPQPPAPAAPNLPWTPTNHEPVAAPSASPAHSTAGDDLLTTAPLPPPVPHHADYSNQSSQPRPQLNHPSPERVSLEEADAPSQPAPEPVRPNTMVRGSAPPASPPIAPHMVLNRAAPPPRPNMVHPVAQASEARPDEVAPPPAAASTPIPDEEPAPAPPPVKAVRSPDQPPPAPEQYAPAPRPIQPSARASARSSQTTMPGPPAAVGASEQEIDPAREQAAPRSTAAPNPSSEPLSINRDRPGAVPASMRALQVEAAVRLENMIGVANSAQQNHGAPSSALAVPQPVPAAPETSPAGAQFAQDLPKSGASLDEVPLTNQMVRGLAAMLKQRGGAMNLRLDPPDLGQVRVQMTLSRGTVAAEFHASTPQAHQLLEKNLSMLRTTLEQQGLTVERLTVAHVPSSAAQHALRDESQPQQQHSQRSQHDAAGSESRGRREHTDDSPRRHSMVDFMNMLEEFQLP